MELGPSSSLLFYELSALWGWIWGALLPGNVRSLCFQSFCSQNLQLVIETGKGKHGDLQPKGHGKKWILLLIFLNLIINHRGQVNWLIQDTLPVPSCCAGKLTHRVRNCPGGTCRHALQKHLLHLCRGQFAPLRAQSDTPSWKKKKGTQAEPALHDTKGGNGGDMSAAVKQFSALRTQQACCLCLQGLPPHLPTMALAWGSLCGCFCCHSAKNRRQQGKKESSTLQSTSELRSK